MAEGINESISENITVNVTPTFISAIVERYSVFTNSLPDWTQQFLNLFLMVLLILIYMIFVWNFYRFISRKDIIKLDLRKYNYSEHPLFAKLFAGILYFIEYVLILPLLIFFWFTVLAFFLLLLAESLELSAIITITAVLVSVIRMSSYYKEGLSSEIAKLFPFTLLAFSILNPNFFDFERIIGHFSQLSEFLNSIFIYFLFIILLEIILRFFDFIFSLVDVSNKSKVREEAKQVNGNSDEKYYNMMEDQEQIDKTIRDF